jgi:Flp pilus assembly pilin Flp
MTQLSTVWGASRTFLRLHLERLRSAARDQDRGASAVELAVITAVILGIAIALLVVIGNFVTGESNQIHG